MCDEIDLDEVKPQGIQDVRDVLTAFSAKTFVWDGGKVIVDATTANMLCTVYDAVSETTKASIDLAIAKSRNHFIKAVDIGWSSVK